MKRSELIAADERWGPVLAQVPPGWSEVVVHRITEKPPKGVPHFRVVLRAPVSGLYADAYTRPSRSPYRYVEMSCSADTLNELHAKLPPFMQEIIPQELLLREPTGGDYDD